MPLAAEIAFELDLPELVVETPEELLRRVGPDRVRGASLAASIHAPGALS